MKYFRFFLINAAYLAAMLVLTMYWSRNLTKYYNKIIIQINYYRARLRSSCAAPFRLLGVASFVAPSL